MANLITNKTLVNTGSLSAETGIKNSSLYDPTNKPIFNQTISEDVWQGRDNTWIVLGRDRPGGWDSGYGGMGHLKAGAIDIVVGRLSAEDSRFNIGPVNPSVGGDAARIYLSQKADIDDYYSIPDGRTGKSKALSAVAIKADAVRIVARDSLKLVTRTDAKLSNGENSYSAVGVQLICKNESDESSLQPIPKGTNLMSALEGMAKNIEELNGIVFNFLTTQQKYNEKIADHTHYSPFFAQKTSLDPNVAIKHKETVIQQFLKVEQGLKFNINNITSWKSQFLNKVSPTYINSHYHFLN